jgi:hypothetical protein
MSEPVDLARIRHDNALRLFDEFVQANVKSADAATLRGLERRFAERLQIQPSYWSQIKARSRQIGERLARQFEQLCRKPAGWMDTPQAAAVPAAGWSVSSGRSDGRPLIAGASLPSAASEASQAAPQVAPSPSQPLDDDERFIVGLVLTYYRRHPQRARARLLDLLGEVLTPPTTAADDRAMPAADGGTKTPRSAPSGPSRNLAPAKPAGAATDDDTSLWQRSQAGVAPLPRKR